MVKLAYPVKHEKELKADDYKEGSLVSSGAE
jgi:hypothetical protein